MLVDGTGHWSYVRIPSAGYQDRRDLRRPGQLQEHPRGGRYGLGDASRAPEREPRPSWIPVYLVTGLQVISFRVLTDGVDGLPKLQQKLGLFDPTRTTRATGVHERDGERRGPAGRVHVLADDAARRRAVWNTASQTISSRRTPASPAIDRLPAGRVRQRVPFQAGPSGAPPPLDIANVIGVRVSVTGRSPLLPLAAQKLTNVDVRGSLAADGEPAFPSGSEDHPSRSDPEPQYDLFDHYRATATLLLRNRIPRG